MQRLRTALNDAVVALDDKITIALLDHTLADPEAEVRREAAGILADLRDVRALPPLIRALSDRSEAVQETAIQGLKKLDDRSAIAALLPKLFNGTPTIQWRAGLALKSLGWHPKTESEEIRYLVATGEIKRLADYGAAAVGPLVELLHRGAGDKKISVINILGEIGDPAAGKPLIGLLRDPDTNTRSAAIYALERAGFHAAAPALVSALKDTARNVRLAAALALGSLGDAQAVESLIRSLEDKDWEIRRAALDALGKIGDKRAFPSVAKRLDDADKEVREGAADALGTVGNESIVEKLVFTMVDAHGSVRQAAARALNRIYPHWERSERVQRLLPEIQAATKHRDANVQSAATSLFQRIAGPDRSQPALANNSARPAPAESILRTMLEDADPEVRVVAAETVGRMKLKACEADLKKALADTADEVKRAAHAALDRIGGANSDGQSKVAFLARVNEMPSTEPATPAIGELLLCSALGEVLHEWQCRDLAGWLKMAEFLLPQAEQLARLMRLGEAKRVAVETDGAQIVIIATPEGSAMFRVRQKFSDADAPDAPDAGLGEAAKEMVAAWLRRLPSARGVLMRGVRFPDQTVLCDTDSRDLPVAAIEEAYHLAADAFHWLKTNRVGASRMVWTGERSELHCARRADKSVLGVMTSAKAGETDSLVLRGQLAEFQSLTVGTPVAQD